MRQALGLPFVFFGGKGGAGKTTLATAHALGCARDGWRTLLVSTDPAHSTSDVLGVALDSEARPVTSGLWAVELDPSVEAERYISDVAERIGQAVPPRLAREVQHQLGVARASPGAEEAALFDRFTRIIDESRFERVVFDTAPSGITVRLLSLPDQMEAWARALAVQRRKVAALGRMWRNAGGGAAGSEAKPGDVVLDALEERRGRFERARDALRDPRRTAFVFVTLAERLPVLETHRIMTALRDAGIPVGGVIVNQLLPAAPGDPFLARRKAREAAHIADIEVRFGSWPIYTAPLLDGDPVGAEALLDLLTLVKEKTGEAVR